VRRDHSDLQQEEIAVNLRRWWIGPVVLFIAAACAGGGAQEQEAAVAPAPSEAAPDQGGGGECGGRYEIQVRNDTFSEVVVSFQRSKVASAEIAGRVNSRDTRSFFIRTPTLYDVWADVGGMRVRVRDQNAQQSAKLYLGVACAG
jgi:hypothetical protein